MADTPKQKKALAFALDRAKPILDQLGVTGSGLERLLFEVQRRLAGENAHHHTKFGTFVEVALAIRPEVMTFRNKVIKTNRRAAIYAALLEIPCFVGRDGTMTALSLDDFPLKPGARRPPIPTGSNPRAIEKFVREFDALLADDAVEHLSDTWLGSKKYIDRGSFLRLKSDRRLALITEEYKGRFSEGGETQSAVRIDRVLHDGSLSPDAKLSGRLDDPAVLAERIRGSRGAPDPPKDEWVEIDADKVLFSMATYTQDQVLLKASADPIDAAYLQVPETDAYLLKKQRYGQRTEVDMKKRASSRGLLKADEGLYKYEPVFPSREIHMIIAILERAN